ncbi:chitinase [Isoptericola hypogeus]|uniref:mannosyl-glycoprotein endo-beta-N-acetylglucosaminidase n=1 Tax=Isoptericola hypogeus TaxID=300179 RepID=A0ABP4V584_9MICO
MRSISRGLAATVAMTATLLAGGSVAAAAAPEPVDETTTGTAAQCADDPLMMAYYRTWRDVTVPPGGNGLVNQSVMSDLPAGVDVAFVFEAWGAMENGYGDALRDEYVPALHAQGTQVVRTLHVGELLDLPVQDDAAGYDRLARQLIAEYVTPADLDGLDVDVEQALSPAELDHVAGIFEALSTYLGPESGTDDLLIYDTNQSGNHPLVPRVAPLVSYVLVQSYGRDVRGLQATWETFAPYISSCQYLIGFSFYEERGHRWGDTEPDFGESRAFAYAKWQPEGGTKGGIFSYAVDRDGKDEGDDTLSSSSYSWTKRLSNVQDAWGR